MIPSPAIVDCDIHNRPRAASDLDPYLGTRWSQYRKMVGERRPTGGAYPRATPNAARTDAWPPNGGPPGSDLDFLRQHHLNEWGIQLGVLNTLLGGGLLNLEYAAAFAHALNDWQLDEWLEREPRLRASIVVPEGDAQLAADEIYARAHDPRFVQVLLHVRTAEPLGRRRYWRLYDVAAECGLPVGIHFGGHGGSPITGAGYPSFYIEDHGGMATAFQDQVVSLVCEGVFQRFPKLEVVLIEGGLAWLPPLMWRLDRSWRLLREEVPHLTELPSETIRRHFWFTTQPLEEPPPPQSFAEMLSELDVDGHILFASDYPHWDFDTPEALPRSVESPRRERILASNAFRLYGMAPERGG